MVELLGWMGLAAALWLTVFQLLLAGGAPLGYLAWGGQDPGRLPRGKRLGSLASAVLGALLACGFAQSLGFLRVLPGAGLFWLFAASAALFALSTIANLASSSRPERLHGAPLAGILAVSSAGLAFL